MTPARTLPRGQAGPVRAVAEASAHPTIWGLTPLQLHDRYWASHGVQVVRPNSVEPLSSHASLYLLIELDGLALFDLPAGAQTSKAELLYLRFRDAQDNEHREHVVTDTAGRFVRFERTYDRARSTLARAAATRNPAIAAAWQATGSWKSLRRAVTKSRRRNTECDGATFDGVQESQVAAFVSNLAKRWPDPSSAIDRVDRVSDEVWRDRDVKVHAQAQFVDQVWIGRGRRADGESLIVGPVILWDDPDQRPAAEPFVWQINKASKALPRHNNQRISEARRAYRFFKRLFDIIFSVIVLVFTLPFYPLIALAIFLEDGRPIFFHHQRETLGGREFNCLKFRSMRRNAEVMKPHLIGSNQADGPQFYILRDPRLTHVGRILRRNRIDEWPQFFNVLAGHMSIVGPRPSPYKENQFCPAWRKLRLSVRPGITGLWQVQRTRRRGADFQEWIRYDIEYVETAGWMIDLKILWRTVTTIFSK